MCVSLIIHFFFSTNLFIPVSSVTTDNDVIYCLSWLQLNTWLPIQTSALPIGPRGETSSCRDIFVFVAWPPIHHLICMTIISTCAGAATSFDKELIEYRTKTLANLFANQLDITNLEQRLHVLRASEPCSPTKTSQIPRHHDKENAEAVLRQHVSLAIREYTGQFSNLVSLRVKSATFIVEFING